MKLFSQQELQTLKEKFRVMTEKVPSSISMPATELMNEQTLRSHLQFVQQQIEAPDAKVAASIFAKRYSFVVLAALYSFTILHKKVNIDECHTSLETLDMTDRLWIPSIYWQNTHVEEVNDGNHIQKREELLQELFAQHVDKIWLEVRHVTKISKLILWENVSVYIMWMYETLLDDLTLEPIKERIQEDFSYLYEKAQGSLFGSYHYNPLAKYNEPKQFVKSLGQDIRVRKTCCFSYQTAAKNQYCTTCPIMCKVKEES
ncbi:(2Fe-2S)-binding protein [Metabacillus iocasae]|uniref:Ferric iron reductase protein FhuF n=1 Tax=Priestia iocasae TaxID=2291674 RepID=A0ABS2R023_9BACI|nr:(2Fe-2S)-binding protein [Metabacillus iocasae]MBM7704562.1 ferric iron reductase protein FhuF [Metabacillus iocasae]